MPHLKKATPENASVNKRILDTALDLFVQRGFHNVSIHDIQKQANVSIGSIYNHFGGKEGVAKALYYHLIREMEELVKDVVDEGLGYRESCNRIIYMLFEYTETKRNIIAYVLHAKHQEFLPDEPPIRSSTPFKTMRNIVQQGIESGEIREGDPWVIASSVFGGAIRLIHLRLDGVLKEPLPKLYDELIDCMWQGVTPAAIQESVA
ncbi:MAG: TetR/AcrR family transcriptional regulator [Candidatus Thiodiazotropha sp. (ex Ctena orbiculata)]|nr:TetR/AcrR family transcriptional regulator [Candidatus Thiodiazotropha taylori]MBT2996591.1 TetR/AcrR family transcriptional regulator [Candidatus Thiodiazotropha taylori]MBT3000631.1 TetR/AcrR family transcriptional regulator [Candidatus Thiodiazotropha taylori]MBV2106960.1 TetR/AcrR family transcriptional regulator [Candidatus Thiodiazotropha taylori]MBV2111102.1 TetR/AcrR family transcriptional regulator [Candidatus Thiodiazotropha taylori]